MNSDEMFNWPDGDIILRATHGTESRDFRVHKLFLSFSSPVFKDMFGIPQPPSADPNGIDVVDVADPPRALEIILRFMYPSPTPPVINDLTVLSEALALADKYDVEVARSRLRSLFKRFAKTEPLRAYAIACRLGLEDEMKIASSHTTSIHLPGLTELPDEFRSIPATEYHRLILLHSRYRKEVGVIAARSPLPRFDPHFFDLSGHADERSGKAKARGVMWKHFMDGVREGIPLDRRSLTLALKADNSAAATPDQQIESHISSILSQASASNLTV